MGIYNQFVKPGELAFDLGACTGSHTKKLLDEGARVIAVEPQPKCAAEIKGKFGPAVVIVNKGVGAWEGEFQLDLNQDPQLATMSKDWQNAVKGTNRFGQKQWTETITVPVTTLDKLIELYGKPVFIKIDVEGFEAEILKGLSVAIKGLSFEFTPEYFDNTRKCVDRLKCLATRENLQYEFCYSGGDAMHLGEWLSGYEVLKQLEAYRAPEWGDVYARLI